MKKLPPSPKASARKKAPDRTTAPSQSADEIAGEQADLRSSHEPDIHRLLPSAADAEQGVLSSFLLAPVEVGDILTEGLFTPEHFYTPAIQVIFKTLMEMREKHQAIDLITLTQLLRDQNKLNEVGGPAFITSLFTMLPTAANIRYYMEIVDEKYALRRIITIGTEFTSRAYDEQDDAQGLLAEFEQAAMAVAQQKVDKDLEYIPTKKVIIDVISNIQDTIDRQGKIGGISTGFNALDAITDGLHRTEMLVIGARPSMGKTALAMNIVEHVAIDQKIPCAVFSLEMSTKSLLHRATLSRARVNWAMVRQGHITERDYPNITASASQIGGAPIYINDKSGISPAYIAAVLRRWVREYGIQVAVIDYLQLLSGSKRYKGDNRQQEVSEISSGLKTVAKNLDIALIVLAAINRTSENNAGSAPKLSNLRESGAIEQDADTVGLLHRQEYYLTEPEEITKVEGMANIQIAKQRNGPVGNVPLTFLKEITRFENRAMDEAPE